ncbi:response regulator transcription factor [Limosilactobacillus caecicola]|uniref:response regulator transcription factor n=1 Tax=Limosilactobacillus caecicola TaxID=2941332 RepID=UPI002041D83B|nr:response regulator transcription factor [Limosilactobacillus caecicola]
MNLLILEDEWIEQVNLEKMINEIATQHHFKINSLNSYSKVEDLEKHLPAPSVSNVYLLDLEVNGDPQAGLKLSKTIRQQDIGATIIFITVHDELMPVTYQYQVEGLDFIAKDKDNIQEHLIRAFTTVQNKIEQVPYPSVLLKTVTGYTKVRIDNILYMMPNPRNSHQALLFLTGNRQITIHGTLNQLEKESPNFFRCHRRCLINLKKVEEINTHDHKVKLADVKDGLPLSRLKVAQLLTLLNRKD